MRILIVDDQALFRQALRALLLALKPGAEVRDLGSGAWIDAAAGGWRADLALVSAGHDGRERLEPLHRLRREFPDAVLLLLAGADDQELLRSAIEAGAAGYIPCSIDPASSMTALQQVLEQGLYLAPEHRNDGGAPDRATLAALSPQERGLLRALLQGRHALARARQGEDEGAVARLWARLGVNGRVQALFRLAPRGLLGPLFADLPPWHLDAADAG